MSLSLSLLLCIVSACNLLLRVWPFAGGPAFDGRRKAGTEMMDKIGRADMSIDQLSKLLDTKPVLADDTDFTALMVPASGSYTTILRSHD